MKFFSQAKRKISLLENIAKNKRFSLTIVAQPASSDFKSQRRLINIVPLNASLAKCRVYLFFERVKCSNRERYQNYRIDRLVDDVSVRWRETRERPLTSGEMPDATAAETAREISGADV